MHPTNFEWALAEMKNGFGVTRAGWNGKGQYVFLRNSGPGFLDGPYLVIRTVDGDYVPWVASQTDLLANDWESVP